MMKNKLRILLLPILMLLVLVFAKPAEAHLPRLVYDQLNSAFAPYVIKTPEISQAFYGQFKNYLPDYYFVTLPSDQDLYLSLLVPDNSNAATGTSLTVIKLNSAASNFAMTLNGKDFAWEKYHEEYAGDNYWQGPNQSSQLSAGDYLVTVSATGNVGKYVLVTGKIESFPFGEMLKTLWALPFLKMVFFETSLATIFAGIIGKYLLWGVILIGVILALVGGLIIKRRILKKTV